MVFFVTYQNDTLQVDIGAIDWSLTWLQVPFDKTPHRYVFPRNTRLVVLLCGGDKSTQGRDIKLALRLAGELED